MAACTRRNPNISLEVGSVPPPINALDLSGNKVSLQSYKGSVILLNFWASWCGPCVSELPNLERLYEKLKGRGLVVIGVGIDDSQANLSEAAKTMGLTFPIAIDQGDAKSEYKLTGVPETLLLDRDGKIILMFDPDTGGASARILGPRDWDSPAMSKAIEAILDIQR